MSWSGTPFTYFFSHCFINYGKYQADDPAQFGFNGPRVDWFENSRRAILTHRQRCLDNRQRYRSFSDLSWGLNPCNGYRENGETTYFVPSIHPSIAVKENWCLGTVAPYAAGASIVFTPKHSMDALREFHRLANAHDFIGWKSPVAGGYGLPDSFNLDQKTASHDALGIDAGPMLVAIENARTGLIWKLFHQHHVAKRATQRLKFKPAVTNKTFE